MCFPPCWDFFSLLVNGLVVIAIIAAWGFIQSLCPLNVPGAKFNLSLIEAVLFSFYGLAKLASPRTIKQVVGYFVMSGQPSDMVGINEARLALEEFRKLCEYILVSSSYYRFPFFFLSLFTRIESPSHLYSQF